MARGKHKARATNRRASYADAVIVQLRSELEMEQSALSEAEETLTRVTRLQSELAAENADLVEEVAPYAGKLREERDYLRAIAADAGLHHARIKDTWNRYLQAAIEIAPGATNLERMESVFRATGLGGYLDSETHLKMKNRNIGAVTRLQRARGDRRNVAEGRTQEQEDARGITLALDISASGIPMMRPGYRQILLDQDVVYIGEDGEHRLREPQELTEEQNSIRTEAIALAKKLWQSRADDLDADGVHIWGSGNLVSKDAEPGNILTALGFDAQERGRENPPAKGPRPAVGLPLPSIPATSRDAIARQNAENVLEAWSDVFKSRRRVIEKLGLASHPFAPLAHHPQPSQGLAVQNAYALAAFSQWIHQGGASSYARAAVGLTAAAVYWLPAGQTASFAESEPMDDSDRAEMILPFQQVFLSFAEPLVIDPSDTVTAQTKKMWEELSAIAHDVYRDNRTASFVAEERVRLAKGASRVPPTIDEMLGGVGGHIEGVLLLADSLGRPQDSFAWCLAIPGAYGSTLGRFVIPALRSTTAYRDVVDNLTAVVAWAQWHEPDQSTAVPLGISREDLEAHISSADFQRNARRSGGDVRVVDVGSTHRKAGARRNRDDDSGIHVTPHIRRGHWRRQRYGQGGEQIKRIRIAPVLVNAHRGDIAPRVYRLRSNT